MVAALTSAIHKARELELGDTGSQPTAPSITSSITISSKAQRQLEKLERKEAKKRQSKGAAGVGVAVDVEILEMLGWEALMEAEGSYKGDWIKGGTGPGAMKALPQGSVRK